MSRKSIIIVISIMIVLSITASIVGYLNKDKYKYNNVVDTTYENVNKNDEITKTGEEKTNIEEEKTETIESESNVNENKYICLDEKESNDKNTYKIKLVDKKKNCSSKSIEFKSKGKIEIINEEEDNNYYDGSILVYTEEGKIKAFDAINNKYYNTTLKESDDYNYHELYKNNNDVYGISFFKYNDDSDDEIAESYVYYSFLDSKLSNSYNFMNPIDDKYLYLGNVVKNNTLVDIKVLDLKTNKIVDISIEEYEGNSGLEEYDSTFSSSYFDVINDKYYFFDSPTKDNKIYDSNFKIIK